VLKADRLGGRRHTYVQQIFPINVSTPWALLAAFRPSEKMAVPGMLQGGSSCEYRCYAFHWRGWTLLHKTSCNAPWQAGWKSKEVDTWKGRCGVSSLILLCFETVHRCTTTNLLLSNGIKIVSVLQRLHGEIGCTNSDVQ